MRKILLMAVLLAGIAFGYLALKPSEGQRQAQESWNLQQQLEREAEQARPGWR
ncbi:hypothetical protein GCM10007159_10000 [Modicisalibacter luteus]|jgi:uncharacterized membrane-anchored protein YhcB (DUF1043 family)|nr:hypothetical protein GCM10007159_10000 [Halomonas lutea]